MNVNGLMTNIVIPTNNEFGKIFFQRIDVGFKIIHEFKLVGETIYIGA